MADNTCGEVEAFLLLNAGGLTPRHQFMLLEALGTAAAVLGAPDTDLLAVDGITRGHVDKLRRAQRTVDASEILTRCGELGVEPIPCSDPRYPALLRQSEDRTPLLFVQGTLERRDDLSIAIVGTRKCTPYGLSMASKLAGDLARRGFTVVSGLAQGIDSQAHRETLEAGGRTIAVMASGADITFPSENRALRQRIAAGGAVVTEYALGTPPHRQRFPARNRLISALSLGVLVIEAPARSGALITARLAGEQGREVFAVPGDATRPESHGTNDLIRDGAHLVEYAEDVVEGLGILLTAVPQREPVASTEGLPEDQRAVVEALSYQPRHVDDIVQSSGVPAARVSAALMMLEMHGLARRLPGSTFVRL